MLSCYLLEISQGAYYFNSVCTSLCFFFFLRGELCVLTLLVPVFQAMDHAPTQHHQGTRITYYQFIDLLHMEYIC